MLVCQHMKKTSKNSLITLSCVCNYIPRRDKLSKSPKIEAVQLGKVLYRKQIGTALSTCQVLSEESMSSTPYVHTSSSAHRVDARPSVNRTSLRSVAHSLWSPNFPHSEQPHALLQSHNSHPEAYVFGRAARINNQEPQLRGSSGRICMISPGSFCHVAMLRAR